MVVISFLFVPLLVSGQGTDYVRFGPSTTLHLAWIVIDSWTMYIISVVGLTSFSALQQYRVENIYPWIYNTLYDPKHYHIKEFTRKEMWFITNGNYFADAVFNIITIWLSISQLDYALLNVFVRESVSVYVTSTYLKRKQFRETLDEILVFDPDEERDIMLNET